MITLTVNGEDWTEQVGGARTLPELVEVIKTRIDPDEIITSITINGQEPRDADWRVPLVVQGNSALAVMTGSRSDYVRDRLNMSVVIAEELMKEFARARALYQSGQSRDGNAIFRKSLTDLNAFIQWYDSILSMLPEAREQQEGFRARVKKMKDVCEQLFQHQLYQSWWALGQTLESELEPKLLELRNTCSVYAYSQPESTIE